MNIEQLYRDYNIIFVTEGHKHTRPGWVNTSCPFCTGNPGYHLGYDINGNKFVCWRCGGHRAQETISKLLNVDWKEANAILKQYGSLTARVTTQHKVKIKPFKLPSNVTELQENHIQYLEKRNFDPNYLIKKYQLKGTGPMAILDKINYKHRIIIPYLWDNIIVSFDSRSISNTAQNKYMACPDAREDKPRKSILYGIQNNWKDVGICVEGPTDVWRLGDYAFAVSGIKYTPAQVRLMSKLFKRVPIMFDGNEPIAKEQADKLVGDLKFRGVDSFRVDIDNDPGSMSESEAKYIVKQLVG
jgi:hypothetical protein